MIILDAWVNKHDDVLPFLPRRADYRIQSVGIALRVCPVDTAHLARRDVWRVHKEDQLEGALK